MGAVNLCFQRLLPFSVLVLMAALPGQLLHQARSLMNEPVLFFPR